MKTSVLQSFTVGVVSIAATIMVLQLTTPESGEFSAFIKEWQTLLAHYISFFLLFILWFFHAKEFSRVEIISPEIALLDGIWLIFLALIPFATGWLERFPNSTAPELVFIVIFTICILLNNLMVDLLKNKHPEANFSKRLVFIKRLPIYVVLVVCMINAFFFPIFNLGILFFLTIYMIYLILRHSNEDVFIL